MKRLVENQEFLWNLAKTSTRKFSNTLKSGTEEQLKSIIERIINSDVGFDIKTLKKHLKLGKINPVYRLLTKHSNTVKTAILIVLTELMSNDL